MGVVWLLCIYDPSAWYGNLLCYRREATRHGMGHWLAGAVRKRYAVGSREQVERKGCGLTQDLIGVCGNGRYPMDCDNCEKGWTLGRLGNNTFLSFTVELFSQLRRMHFFRTPSHSASAYPSGDERQQALTRLYGSLAVAVATFVRYL